MAVAKHPGKFLIFGAAIMPFTSLRVGPIGLGELIFLGSFLELFALRKGHLIFSNSLFFSKFWIQYIVLTIFSFFFSYFILGYPSGTLNTMIFDLIAFFVVLVSVYTVEAKRSLGQLEPLNFIWHYYIVTFIIFATLHTISYITPSVAGFQLRYYEYFAPLVNNVHQTAMMLCVLPFLGLFFLKNRKGLKTKFFIFFSIIWFTIMSSETGSSKAILGLVLGYAVFLFHSLFLTLGNKKQKVLIMFLMFLLTVVVALANYTIVVKEVTRYFIENDGQGARAILYSLGFDHALKSIFFGYGPGPHIDFTGLGNSFWDAHNTLLSIFLQGGIVGVILFLRLFIFSVLPAVFANSSLLACLAPIIVYVAGGDILRRLPIWLLLVFIVFLAQTNSSDKRTKIVLNL